MKSVIQQGGPPMNDTTREILTVTVPWALAFGIIVGLLAYWLTPAPFETPVGAVIGVAAALVCGIDATRRNLNRAEDVDE